MSSEPFYYKKNKYIYIEIHIYSTNNNNKFFHITPTNAKQKKKILLPFDDPISAVEEVARKTAANRSSMLQDVLRGAPTEIDAICGALVQAAEKHNFQVPVTWACWQLVRALEKGE